MRNTIATKCNRSILPTNLIANLKAINGRTSVVINVHKGDTIEIVTGSDRWEGGTRTEYRIGDAEYPERQWNEPYFVPFQVNNVSQYWQYVVENTVFCGKECSAVFHVREKDIPLFFGVIRPVEHKDTPADVFADWVEEQAEHATGKESKRLRQAAKNIRTVMGVI